MAKGEGSENLGFSKISLLGKSRFNEYIIQKNGLDAVGFECWIFCPGMLFNTLDKWWGDRERRDRAHEGLDLCLYRDRRGRILRLDEKTKIPVMYDGIVVKMINDFLGMSVIVEHGLSETDESKFCTIYAHTTPRADLRAGRTVREGEIVATLANSSRSKDNILPHLHVSLGWSSKVVSYDDLDWDKIGVWNTLTLLDPLCVIDWPYLELEGALAPCREL